MFDGRVVLTAESVVIGPQLPGAGAAKLPQFRADVVTGCDEQLVANDQRRGGIHGWSGSTKREQRGRLAAFRIDGDAVEPRDKDGLFLATDLGERGGRITGDFGGGLPQGLAGERVEGHDARAFAA